MSQYFTNTGPNNLSSPLPTNAVRLTNGNTVIADQFSDRIIINPSEQIVYQYGMTNIIGNGFVQLYAPYTAYVIGDCTRADTSTF